MSPEYLDWESGVLGLGVRGTWTDSPEAPDSLGLVLSLDRFLIIGIPNQGIRVSLKQIISSFVTI